MKDWYILGNTEPTLGPLVFGVASLLLAALWLACRKPPEALASMANAGAPGASAAAAAAPAENAPQATPASGPTGALAAQEEVAILAGGCFWGMEEILRQIPGVLQVDVGYTGGSTPNPGYREVSTGLTGHAEAVRVLFDPGRLSYADLLEKFFFRMHDPTTKNRQGYDIGSQYRSAIFATTAEQRSTAEKVKAKVEASGFWDDPIVTEVVDAGPFTLAEDEHQDYLQKHPGGYTCHFLRR